MSDPELDPQQPEGLAEAYGATVLDYMARQRAFLEGESPEGGASVVRELVEQRHESLPPGQADALYKGANELRALEGRVDFDEFEAAFATSRYIENTAEALAALIRVARNREGAGAEPMSAASLEEFIKDQIYPQLLKASDQHAKQSDRVYSREQKRELSQTAHGSSERDQASRHTTYDPIKPLDSLLG